MSSEPIEWFDIPSVLGRRAASILGLSKVPIVELDESHRPLILAHLLALDETDRRLRFSYALGDAAIAKYAASLDFERDSVFGIFGRDDVLLGVVHLAELNSSADSTAPKGAELGLSLDANMRGHGLGTLLFQRALRRARNEGIEMLFIYTLMDNEAMLRIAHKLNMRVSNADGQCEAHLRVEPASTSSVVREFVDEHLADLDHLFKGSLNQFKKWAEEF
ncbi:GNAT family N-acetyltransferase [Limnobacter sp.]|uniref:GNAT family N-acetyltransferase n=1 Tax=Limnobacter sp. TaxID=2003368 RepID=UPI003747EBD3